jgi:hypothetical protein
MVQEQDQVNKANIKTLEEGINQFNQDMRKRPFF